MSKDRISRRLKNLFSFGRLTGHDSGVQTSLQSGETLSGIEHPQEHGFASKAPIGSNTYCFFQDGNRDNGAVIIVAGTTPLALDTGDSVQYSAGGAFVHCEGSTIHINGDAFGGLVKVDDLTTKLNLLITEISSKTGTSGYSPFVAANYENTDVTHG
jgi:phage gp45-like